MNFCRLPTIGLSILFLAALVACAPISGFTQEQRIRVGFSAMSGSMAWLWTAKEGGYFDQHGLKVDLVYVGGTAQLFQSMLDRKSTRLNSSHYALSRMPSSA